jgi:hypothetical protein
LYLCERAVAGDLAFDEMDVLAGDIEELHAKSITDLCIPNYRTAGNQVGRCGDLEPHADHRADRIDLATLDICAADRQVTQYLVSPRKDAVLTDPKLGAETDAFVLAKILVHDSMHRKNGACKRNGKIRKVSALVRRPSERKAILHIARRIASFLLWRQDAKLISRQKHGKKTQS